MANYGLFSAEKTRDDIAGLPGRRTTFLVAGLIHQCFENLENVDPRLADFFEHT